MNIAIRPYRAEDIPAMNAIWNEVVEDGVAFPQEECLDLGTGAAFFAAQTHCGVAEETETEEGEEAAPVAKDFISRLNPDSRTVRRGYAEPIVRDAEPGATYQFLRVGYFCKDPDSTDALPVFNRTVGLRDSFVKQLTK